MTASRSSAARGVLLASAAAAALALAACGSGPAPAGSAAHRGDGAALPAAGAPAGGQVTVGPAHPSTPSGTSAPTPAASRAAPRPTTKAPAKKAPAKKAPARKKAPTPAATKGNLGSLHLKPLPAGRGRTYQTTVSSRPGEEFGTGTVKVWLPSGIRTVRGLLVPGVFDEGGQDIDDVLPPNDAFWEAEARKWHFGIVGHRYTHKAGTNNRREAYGEKGSGKGLLRALVQLGRTSGHREIGTAPIVTDGYSLKAVYARGLASVAPDRVILVTMGGGGFPLVKDYPRVATVPFLVYGGDSDDLMNEPRSGLAQGRAKGAPWAAALQPQRGHDVRPTTPITGDWWDAIIPIRVPATPGAPLIPIRTSTGYWGGWGGSAVTAATGKGASTTSWLPSRKAATDWQGFWKRHS